MISEDLSYDRVSKMFPHLADVASRLNTDETNEKSDEDKYQSTDKRLITQLLNEINLLKLVIQEKDAVLKYRARVCHVGVNATKELKD